MRAWPPSGRTDGNPRSRPTTARSAMSAKPTSGQTRTHPSSGPDPRVQLPAPCDSSEFCHMKVMSITGCPLSFKNALRGALRCSARHRYELPGVSHGESPAVSRAPGPPTDFARRAAGLLIAASTPAARRPQPGSPPSRTSAGQRHCAGRPTLWIKLWKLWIADLLLEARRDGIRHWVPRNGCARPSAASQTPGHSGRTGR